MKPTEIPIDDFDFELFSMAYEKFQSTKLAADTHVARLKKMQTLVNGYLAKLATQHNFDLADYRLDLTEKKFILIENANQNTPPGEVPGTPEVPPEPPQPNQ